MPGNIALTDYPRDRWSQCKRNKIIINALASTVMDGNICLMKGKMNYCFWANVCVWIEAEEKDCACVFVHLTEKSLELEGALTRTSSSDICTYENWNQRGKVTYLRPTCIPPTSSFFPTIPYCFLMFPGRKELRKWKWHCFCVCFCTFMGGFVIGIISVNFIKKWNKYDEGTK